MIALALANLLRQRLRSGVTALGVAVAVGMLFLLLAFQQGYQRGLRTELDRLGAHILVVPKGCPYDSASLALHGASWPCYLKAVYLQEVRQTPQVAVAAPVLMNAFYDSATGAQRVYCGVEESFPRLRPHWRFAAGSFPTEPGGVLLGASVAAELGATVGKPLALPGIEGAQARVAGILAPTQSAEDLFFFLPLKDTQRLFKRPDALTHILVKLADPDAVGEVTTALRGCDAGLEMTVVPLAHLFETINALIRATRLLLGCVALVALLTAAAGVTNTILMAVSERTREIGVLRALGVSPGGVFALIWLETVLLCLIGSGLGIVLAALSGTTTERWLRAHLPFTPTDPLLRPDLMLVGGCLLVGPVLGTLAALLPALRAARLSPALALKEGAP